VTRITLQDGKIVLRDGKVGTEEACCCGACECVECDKLYNVSVTVEGSKLGAVTKTFAIDDPAFFFQCFGAVDVDCTPNGNVGDRFGFVQYQCSRFGDSTFISVQYQENEIIPFGTQNIFDVIVTWFCGTNWGTEDGEWYLLVVASVEPPNQNPYDKVLFDAEKLYQPQDCGPTSPIVAIDTGNMTVNNCNLGGVAQNPCPVRIRASLVPL
jgi:hypothetical protein